MGRPARPLSILELEGGRGVARRPSKAIATARGRIQKPRGLDPTARRLWDLVVRERGDWLGESDGPALQSLCETWSLRCRALKLLADDPADKLARTAYSAYQATFERLGSKFGLSPSDRARLGEVDPAEHDPAAEFIA